MREKLFILICILFMLVHSKVMFLVSPEIYSDPGCLDIINEYSVHLFNECGVTSIVEEDKTTGSGNTHELCWPVRDLIGGIYDNFKNTPDPLTGVVLIGDIPPPMFYGMVVFGSDYYYMDCYDQKNNQLYHPFSDNVWNFQPAPGDELFHGYDGNVGDEQFDIWVSRVSASYLQRCSDEETWSDPNTPDFMTPREIIIEYTTRAIEWMTERAKIPPRGFGMGDIYGYNPDKAGALNNIMNLVGFESLDLDFRNYFVRPHEDKPDFFNESYLYNNGANWQSQLQAGPFGNKTYGAFKGVSNDPLNEVDNTNDRFLQRDNAGYLFAFVVEHGHREGHTFGVVSEPHGNHYEHSKPRHGNFDSFNNLPLWDRVSSSEAHDGGTYYECRNRDRIYKWTSAKPESEYIMTYTQEMDASQFGDYDVEMWIPDVTDLHNYNYVNCYLNENLLTDGPFDQRGSGPSGWKTIGTVTISANHFHTNCPNLLYLGMTVHRMPAGVNNDRTVADALRLSQSGVEKFLIDPDKLGPDQEFYYENKKDRQSYSMKFDGGRSKTKFFFHNVCEGNWFTRKDKTGNAYALTDNGLISVGTAEINYNSRSYATFFQDLNNDLSFGEAFINYATRRGFNSHYQLLGFGSVYKKAFKPYFEFENDITLNLDLLDKHYDLYVQENLTLEDGTVSDNSVLNAKAGRSIVIKPDNLFESGSSVTFKIDPDLL